MSDVTNLKISGMTCGHCVKNATKALESVQGVESVEVTLEPGAAKIIGNADHEALLAAVKDAGYEAQVV
ncbi:MAG: cation transporter [Pseudomonadota bacterium]|nr:cation transporter [Pseudomonadota bacterium]